MTKNGSNPSKTGANTRLFRPFGGICQRKRRVEGVAFGAATPAWLDVARVVGFGVKGRAEVRGTWKRREEFRVAGSGEMICKMRSCDCPAPILLSGRVHTREVCIGARIFGRAYGMGMPKYFRAVVRMPSPVITPYSMCGALPGAMK